MKDRIATITLNRPERKNAINAEMRRELYAALTDIRDNSDVWVAIITGANGAFSTGHDLSEPLSVPGSPEVYELYELQRQIHKPMIAAINGVCMAQGCGLALGCDIRIAAEHVTFGWPQVKRGICSISGPTMFARLVGWSRAAAYLLTGDTFGTKVAQELGLINHTAPGHFMMQRAADWAQKVVANAPLAVQAMKRATLESLPMPPDEAYEHCHNILSAIEQTADAQEGMTAFKEKRQPVWRAK